VEIADMHRQTEARESRLLELVPSPRASEVVAVVSGAGNAELFRSLGASRIVEGGQSMNPATADILEGVEAVAAPEVVVLPNNPNVVLSAEQAAAHAEKQVRVVPTQSIPAGIAAMVAFDAQRSADENAAEMEKALDTLTTGAVTIASRDVDLNGIAVRKGAYLGLSEGEPIAGGEDFEQVARTVIERLLAEPRGVLTLLTGEDVPALNGLLEGISAAHPELEVEVHDGGQPYYQLLLSAE
jgi:dihydroxyacetone kinase-like predicted kinase